MSPAKKRFRITPERRASVRRAVKLQEEGVCVKDIPALVGVSSVELRINAAAMALEKNGVEPTPGKIKRSLTMQRTILS